MDIFFSSAMRGVNFNFTAPSIDNYFRSNKNIFIKKYWIYSVCWINFHFEGASHFNSINIQLTTMGKRATQSYMWCFIQMLIHSKHISEILHSTAIQWAWNMNKWMLKTKIIDSLKKRIFCKSVYIFFVSFLEFYETLSGPEKCLNFLSASEAKFY